MKALKGLFIFLLITVFITAGIYHYFFISMSSLPEGEYINSYKNSEADCKINIYLCSGSATTGYSIRGEVEYKNARTKNIYWSYNEQRAEVSWIDSETVNINGRVLNIYNDVFDFRKYI